MKSKFIFLHQQGIAFLETLKPSLQAFDINKVTLELINKFLISSSMNKFSGILN